MARILVTGGAGYIGSVLVPELLDRGHFVRVLDNFMYKTPSLAMCCLHPNFELIRGDCRDPDVIRNSIGAGIDYAIPLAALVGAPLCAADKVGARTVNLQAQMMLLEELPNDTRVIMPITNSGYGVGTPGEMCTEESPLNPVSDYGWFKVLVEEALMKRGNAISLRLATVFGMSPRMRLDLLVNDFVYRAVYDRAVVLFEGHFKRNYIHVRDVVGAFIHAIDRFELMKDNVYNVGLSSANLSKEELCAVIAKQIPSFVWAPAPIGKDPDQRDYIVSNEKLEKTGWRPFVSLDEGIRELIKGYQMIKNNQYSNI